MRRMLTTLCFFAMSTHANAESMTFNDKQMSNMQIRYVQATPVSSTQTRLLTAEVVLPPSQIRIVTAMQAGLIDAMHVSAGQEVKKGQVIAHIISNDLTALQSDYLQTFTKKRLADSAFQRDSALFKDGIIAQRRYLETQSTHEELTVLLAEKKQTLLLAGMSESQIKQLSTNRRMSAGLSITSPINGQVVEQTGQVGERVDMASPLYKIAQLSPLWLEIHVPIEQALSIQPGMRVFLPKQSLEGKIDSVLRQLNKNNQTMQVRATIAVGAEKLAIGQFVEADIQLNSHATQFKLPSVALARHGKQNFVFVKTSAGFSPTPVQVNAERDHEVIVSGQLTGKEQIAISGIAALKGHWLGLGGE